MVLLLELSAMNIIIMQILHGAVSSWKWLSLGEDFYDNFF